MSAFLKALAIAGVAPLLVSAASNPVVTSTALTIPSPFTGSFLTVPRLDCGTTRGSGVRVSDDIIITAAHVIDGAPCTAFGLPTTVVHTPSGKDFAAIRLPSAGGGLRAIISCDGIREGQRYSALGYPMGLGPDVEPMLGTSTHKNGQAMLKGRAYHGMSGGAVIDEAGAVVAILNAVSPDVSYTFVTELSATYLCGAA